MTDKPLPRFECTTDYGMGIMEEDPTGDYVRYADYLERVRAMEAAVQRWRRARIAACEVGLQHPDYMDRLNELSEAEDALSVAKEPG